MQIDFHYAVTYILARIAGFNREESSVISYASQYVDDATNSGLIRFSNGVRYSRISSSHKMVDSRNFRLLANLQVWLPFHFLPGNDGKEPGAKHTGSFIKRLVCTPDSYVAFDMVSLCIKDAGKPYALHRLGITLHTLADTFSHQGFAGVSHEINDVKKLDADGLSCSINRWEELCDRVKSVFVKGVLPLGHGAALSYPDLPFLKWSYVNGLNQKKERDNMSDYILAIEAMHRALVRFRIRDPEAKIQPISKSDMDQLKKNMKEFIHEDSKERHKQWADSIYNGDFSFAEKGTEQISYNSKGKKSWKYLALKTEKEEDDEDDRFVYHDDFLTSHWKLFHDALQKHRLEVLRDILPKYGICGA